MRKIVGFKINLRAWELQRRAKKAGNSFPENSQDEIQTALDKVIKTLKPAILFETFGRDDTDQKIFSPLSGLAYSLILATLGETENCAIDPILMGHEALLWESALEECRKFAIDLIDAEAKKDACELSPTSPLLNPEALDAAVKKLEGHKIGVTFSENRLMPSASSASTLSWISKIKRKKPVKSAPVREPGADSLKDPAPNGPTEGAS